MWPIRCAWQNEGGDGGELGVSRTAEHRDPQLSNHAKTARRARRVELTLWHCKAVFTRLYTTYKHLFIYTNVYWKAVYPFESLNVDLNRKCTMKGALFVESPIVDFDLQKILRCTHFLCREDFRLRIFNDLTNFYVSICLVCLQRNVAISYALFGYLSKGDPAELAPSPPSKREEKIYIHKKASQNKKKKERNKCKHRNSTFGLRLLYFQTCLSI